MREGTRRCRARTTAMTRAALLLLLLALVVVCVLSTTTSSAQTTAQRMRVHSLMPPLLHRYWANGMRYWAFGRHTIVTDRYVLLNEAAAEAKGYLWNRLHNRAEQFTLNVTLRMRDRSSQWFDSGKHSGIGIWYTRTQRVNYLSDAAFFGFQARFAGVGVVLDHSDTVTLVRSDSDTTALSADALHATASSTSSCHIPYLSTHPVTLSLVYANDELNVYYAVYDTVDDDAVNDDNHDDAANAQGARLGGVPLWLADDALSPRTTTWCGRLTGLQLSAASYHFGVTAANDKKSTAGHVLYRIVLTALPDATASPKADGTDADAPPSPPREAPRLLVQTTGDGDAAASAAQDGATQEQ